LHNFTNGSDGGYPFAPPIQGTDGNFYGTTVTGGGSSNCSGGCGTVYKITSQGTLTTLHQFDNADGSLPYVPLIQATDGNFYGTASSGGATNCMPGITPGGCGTIFKLSPLGRFTLLHVLDYNEGRSPSGPLVQGADGNFYGTARVGVSTTCKFGTNPFGCGTIFKLTP